MAWYSLCVSLHLLAMVLWFGHMLFWSIFAGPSLKYVEPSDTAARLRELSLKMGGLGWPSLVVLIATGTVMLSYRGVTMDTVLSGQLFLNHNGHLIATKFLLVFWMILYQSFFGHRRAPRAIYINMLAALLIVGVSVLWVRT